MVVMEVSVAREATEEEAGYMAVTAAAAAAEALGVVVMGATAMPLW